MTAVLKACFTLATAATTLYSIHLLGHGPWSWAFLGIALFVALSLGVPPLDRPAIAIGKISGVLALLALALLLLAGTIGGSFRLSQSNVVFAVLLATMGLFGISAFAWRARTGGADPHDEGESQNDA